MLKSILAAEALGSLLYGLRGYVLLPRAGRRPGDYALWALLWTLGGMAGLCFLPFGWVGMALLLARFLLSGGLKALAWPGLSPRALLDLLAGCAWRRVAFVGLAWALVRFCGAADAAACIGLILYELFETRPQESVAAFERALGRALAGVAVALLLLLWLPDLAGRFSAALAASAFFLGVIPAAPPKAGPTWRRTLPLMLSGVVNPPAWPAEYALYARLAATAALVLTLALSRGALYSAWLPVRAAWVRRRARRGRAG